MVENNHKQKEFLSNFIERARQRDSKYICITGFSDKKDPNVKAVQRFFEVKDVNVDEMLNTISTLNTHERGVFIALHSLKESNRQKTSVLNINYIFIDLDENPTEKEAKAIYDYITNLGLKFSYLGKSKNGYHMLIPVNLNVEHEEIVKSFLEYLKNDILKKLDSTMYKLSQVMRFPGSKHFKLEEFELKSLRKEAIKQREDKKKKELNVKCGW